MRMLLWLSDLPIIGGRLKNQFVKWTGGVYTSEFLREYTKRKYKVDVGLYSYGGCVAGDFNTGGSVSVGRYCSIAPGVHYFGGEHPLHYVSMSPFFYNPALTKNAADIPRGHLEIGNDCWIGYGAIITSKCRGIGNGAVVAAGSIVTKDVPPYAVVMGAPAKVVRYRFDEETIALIEKSAWWNYTPKECMRYYAYIQNPSEFCEKIGQE